MKKKLFLCVLIALGAIMATSCSSDSESVAVDEITHLQLSHATLNLNLGDSKQLTVKPTPNDATLTDLIWSTANDVASVSNDGIVTALKIGTTTVTVSTKDKRVSATAVVRVISPTFMSELYSLTKGETKKLELANLSDSFKNKNLIWKSSDLSVATVTNDGVLSAIGTGKTTITVTAEDGSFSASCEVTVDVKVESVTMNVSSVELPKGKTFQLQAEIKPEDAVNKNVSWKSYNPNVASVDDSGLVHAIDLGKTTITVTTEDGGYTSSCLVEVTSTNTIEYTPYGEEKVW